MAKVMEIQVESVRKTTFDQLTLDISELEKCIIYCLRLSTFADTSMDLLFCALDFSSF